MMSCVLTKEPDQIIESRQILRHGQQDPITMTKAQQLAAAITLQMLNEIHVLSAIERRLKSQAALTDPVLSATR